jgi:hypothetical protein
MQNETDRKQQLYRSVPVYYGPVADLRYQVPDTDSGGGEGGGGILQATYLL